MYSIAMSKISPSSLLPDRSIRIRPLVFPLYLFSKGCSLTLFFCLLIVLMQACGKEEDKTVEQEDQSNIPAFCDEDNTGLVLPKGFCAGVVADSLGFIRHLAVRDNGDIYVAMRNNRLDLGGILALHDQDGDGKMDQIEKFSDIPGMGISIAGDNLYFASDTVIYRYSMQADSLLPKQPPEVLVNDLPEQELHAGKTFATDGINWIYVNIGATSNACQVEENEPGSPGQDPCPDLENHAGIWRFDLKQLNQSRDSGYRYASGIRNAYAIDWHPEFKGLYIVQHGRDRLFGLWPELYDESISARLPAEEFLRINEGENYSWPYCYYDPVMNKRVLAPEYGGDGTQTGQCDQYSDPLVAFPAHYSPNDLKFYPASGLFPERYYNGAFIAFHGSYNRGDLKQVGYQVVFVPFKNGVPSGDWEIFIDGFAGTGEVTVPEDADYRPTGIAIGPDGSLYVADSVQGRIWRITYMGNGN